jgi:hypothetical protein
MGSTTSAQADVCNGVSLQSTCEATNCAGGAQCIYSLRNCYCPCVHSIYGDCRTEAFEAALSHTCVWYDGTSCRLSSTLDSRAQGCANATDATSCSQRVCTSAPFFQLATIDDCVWSSANQCVCPSMLASLTFVSLLIVRLQEVLHVVQRLVYVTIGSHVRVSPVARQLRVGCAYVWRIQLEHQHLAHQLQHPHLGRQL